MGLGSSRTVWAMWMTSMSASSVIFRSRYYYNGLAGARRRILLSRAGQYSTRLSNNEVNLRPIRRIWSRVTGINILEEDRPQAYAAGRTIGHDIARSSNVVSALSFDRLTRIANSQLTIAITVIGTGQQQSPKRSPQRQQQLLPVSIGGSSIPNHFDFNTENILEGHDHLRIAGWVLMTGVGTMTTGTPPKNLAM